MLVDVVFLEQGDTKPLRSGGHLFAWREVGQFGVKTEKWEQSAQELVRMAVAGGLDPLEVFLCLKVDQPEDLLKRNFLADLVRAACIHGWGANVYVVVDSVWDPLNDLIEGGILYDRLDSLCLWFEAIYEAGATDVIQASIKPSEQVYVWDDPVSLGNLLTGADSSRRRHEALLPEGNWKGLRRREDQVLKWFLTPFEIYSDSLFPPSVQGNIVTILEDSSPARQKKMVDSALIASHGKHLVAMRRSWAASDYIERLKSDKRLRTVGYRGSFELRYLFHLLDTGRQSVANHAAGRVDFVAANNPAFFNTVQIDEPPGLLVSNAFHPAHPPIGAWHILQGAREVGESTIRRPSHTKYVVQPAVGCGSLPGVIRSLPRNLTAWLHVGHGDRRLGLQEASGDFHLAQRWLDCFKGHAARGGSLALAIFSACETEDIARRFAQAGVGVAIGFEQPVPGDACRLLTAPIINAALRSRGDRDAILQAFHAGCAELQISGHPDPGPAAFCS